MGKVKINPYATILLLLLILSIVYVNGNSYPLYSKQEKGYSYKYMELLDAIIEFTPQEIELLEQNKFIVLNRMAHDDIQTIYKFYWNYDLPVFITTDTILHTWHLFFDKSLEKIEEYIYYPILKSITREMVTLTRTLPYSTNPAVRKTLIYCSVAAKLLDSSFTPLHTESDQLYNAIIDEITIEEALVAFTSNDSRRFIDDFTQYKPRGHYIHSEALQQYFRAYKWFSRIPFFFDDYPGENILNTEAIEMIESAVYLVWIIKNVQAAIDELESLIIDGEEMIQYFGEFLELMIGKTHTVHYDHLLSICEQINLSVEWNPQEFTQADYQAIQSYILEDSSIPTPKSPFFITAYSNSLVSPKTLVLFGEALSLDTYALEHLVYPYAGNRFLPKGLDLPAVCLESTQAYKHLEDELNSNPAYEQMFLQMKTEIKETPQEEKQTIYWKWVEALGNLIKEIPETTVQNPLLPDCMKTEAWLDEKLTTIMGSWAQLKHDTILYSKQGYTTVCSTPYGYVEPYPKFYHDLTDVLSKYKLLFTSINNLGFKGESSDFRWYSIFSGVFEDFESICNQLEAISIKELDNMELSDKDKEYIKAVYYEVECGSGGPLIEGWLGNILEKIIGSTAWTQFPQSRASLIADIHTDLNTGNVLHIATGLMEHIVAILPGWDNEEVVAVGPVFSYFEFPLASYRRLTDTDWRGIIYSHINDGLDGKIDNNYSFAIRGSWAESYMLSKEIPTTLLTDERIEYEVPNWVVGEEPELEHTLGQFWYDVDYDVTPKSNTHWTNPWWYSQLNSQNTSTEVSRTYRTFSLLLIEVFMTISIFGLIRTYHRKKTMK
jgi:hypothetical protein